MPAAKRSPYTVTAYFSPGYQRLGDRPERDGVNTGCAGEMAAVALTAGFGGASATGGGAMTAGVLTKAMARLAAHGVSLPGRMSRRCGPGRALSSTRTTRRALLRESTVTFSMRMPSSKRTCRESGKSAPCSTTSMRSPCSHWLGESSWALGRFVRGAAGTAAEGAPADKAPAGGAAMDGAAMTVKGRREACCPCLSE